jgi:probable DNA repair protein
MPQQVLDTLAQGGVVLCANARAARALGTIYGEHAGTSQGRRRAWETPRIFEWRQWLHTQWQQLLLTGHETRTLLSPLQEEVQWNEIVRPAIERRSLIAPAEVARLAMSGYSLLSSYDATNRLQQGAWDVAGMEPELFRRWAMEFERRCKRDQLLSEARLPWIIVSAMEAGRIPVPPTIAWNGFDRLTPVHVAFRQMLEQEGCRQAEVAWGRAAAERLASAPGIGDEIEASALWAREQLERNPVASIGILLPAVEGQRAEVDRVFRRVFSSENAARPAYEFTLGMPLADVPVIAGALAMLQWCVRPREQQAITWMMTSGFFCRSHEVVRLADADIRMRRKLTAPELGMEDALNRLSQSGDVAAFRWVRRMRAAQAVLQKWIDRAQTCTKWVSVIGMVLKEAGWPGDNGLDSINFQAMDRWQRALDQVSGLSFQDRRYTYVDFLAVLQAHVRSSIFAPESLGAPITISGIFETAGRCFDAVWVMGMTDEAWPATSRKHVLLPPWLQNELEMPGSSAAQDWLLAAAAKERLRTSCDTLVFSYATEGKEGEQRPSAVLADLQIETLHAQVPKRLDPLESFTDEMVVPWPGGRSAGGQDVLKEQSACPFKAFASKRLKAKELPSLQPGLSAADRGSVVHAALATFWMEQRDSDHLKALIFNNELAGVVRRHVAKAFEKHEVIAATEWERRYLELEKDRVCALLEQWLRVESGRRPFEVELAEKEELVTIDGLDLTVRMDRVDQVEKGRILIDYKTGNVKSTAWIGERIAEPQLPLYAISGRTEELRDVMFAQVKTDSIRFVSAVFGEKPDIFERNNSGIDGMPMFLEMREQWTNALHVLSREFQQGVATVTPVDYPVTCKFCDFPGLCRIAESRVDTGDDEDEE